MLNRIVFCVGILAVQAAGAETCAFEQWSKYQGSLLRKHATRPAYIFATDNVGVDADGAPNAYHPDDVGLNCTKGTGFKGLDCPENAGYPTTS